MKKLFVKFLVSLVVVLSLMILCCVKSHAYIDPSVMTYTIQAVAGIAIAIGAAIGMYFRSAKRKIGKKLGYDENKNKEVESDEIIVNKEEVKK